jgi:sugar lactone lactonase YvrE
MRTSIIVLVLLAIVSLPIVTVAAGEKEQPSLVLRHFVTLPTGLGAEGLVIHDGHFYVGTFSFTATDGTILVYDKDGSLTQRFTVTGLPQVGQLVFTGDETLVAVAGNLASGKGSVVKVNVETGKITTFASGFKLPNGIVVDAHGNFFVTDLVAGSVSKITQDGTVSTLASGGLLAPAPIPGAGLTLGSNDLVFNEKQTTLYVTNVGQNIVVKITIGKDGKADAITKFASIPGPDGIAFDNRGLLYVTSPFTNSVYAITSNGSTQKLSIDTTNEPFNNPSNLAFHGRQLYITNLAISGTGSITVVTVQPADDD